MHGKYTSTALTLAIQRKEEKRREQRRHSFLMLPVSQVANNKRMQGMYRENHFFLIVPENWSSWYCEDLFLSWLTHFLMCAEVNKRTSVISQHYFFFVTPGNWNGWRYDFLSFLYIYIYVFHIYAEFNCQYFFFPFFWNGCEICFFAGEVVSIPLARTVTSIWPLPFGLLLQQATEGISPAHLPFSSSSPLLGGRDITRPKREIGHSPRQNFSLLNTFDYIIKGDGASFSSHLILKDPLEEPHVWTFVSLWLLRISILAAYSHVETLCLDSDFNLTCYCGYYSVSCFLFAILFFLK